MSDGKLVESGANDFLAETDGEAESYDPPREATYDGDEDAYSSIMAKVKISDVSSSALAFQNSEDNS